MEHRHVSFVNFEPRSKTWNSPSITPIRITAQELKEARSSPEQFLELAKRLKAEGRF